jgi:hypothetical protein
MYLRSDDDTEHRGRYKRYEISLLDIIFFWVVVILWHVLIVLLQNRMQQRTTISDPISTVRGYENERNLTLEFGKRVLLVM